jgi:hypothetical protein
MIAFSPFIANIFEARHPRRTEYLQLSSVVNGGESNHNFVAEQQVRDGSGNLDMTARWRGNDTMVAHGNLITGEEVVRR